jgi:hypothetical protein
MERRELLKLIAAATGCAMVGSTGLLAGCTREPGYSAARFASDDVTLLTDITETIMPRTATPGATDAEVVPFMMKLVDNTYTDEQQAIFHNGLISFRTRCLAAHGTDFANLDLVQRTAFLVDLDDEARTNTPPTADSVHYFTLIKQLTLFSYFTSEIVQTQVLRHVPVPGHYDGCYPYREGETAWAI